MYNYDIKYNVEFFARGSFVQNRHWIFSTLFVKSFDMSPSVIKNKFSTNVIELVALRRSMPDQNISLKIPVNSFQMLMTNARKTSTTFL